MKLRPPLSLLLVGLYAFAFSSCVSENRKSEVDRESTEASPEAASESSKAKVKRIKKIFYSLPSPLELTLLFKEEGIEYDREKLHPTERRDDYLTSTKKALNLGVYGADLSYAGLFGEHQDAIQYFTATHLVAADIGIEQTFQKEFISRLEKNANNKDTLLNVIGEFFMNNDKYLKNHKQEDVSSYVLAGGWIEGLYLGTNMAKHSNSEGLKNLIADQEPSLKNLIALLNDIEDKEEIEELIRSVEELEVQFQHLVARKDEPNDSTLTEIRNRVAGIREQVIN